MKDVEIKERIKQFMDARNLSQNELANMIGYDQSNLSKVLKGGRAVPANLKELITEKTDISRRWLLYGEGNMTLQDAPTIGRPYYDVDFLGGFDVMVNDQTATPAYFIDFNPYNKEGVCWCNITGRSMEPKIEHGDIIALKEIEDRRNIEYGDIYAIVTDYDLRTVKIVRRGADDEHLRLIPINKDFDEQEVEKASIIRMYKVVCNIKRL